MDLVKAFKVIKNKCPVCGDEWDRDYSADYLFRSRCGTYFNNIWRTLNVPIENGIIIQWSFYSGKCFLLPQNKPSQEIPWIDYNSSKDRLQKLLLWI